MTQTAYRVLARKYRPTRFADLIGQEVLVRTLSNAIESGRIAHAFLLTGIRGVGKTTTARIIARGLCCTGTDGQGGPTIEPCGVCPNCTMIGDDRHMDVIEMDAASHTGVSDIRDLIDTVHYLPTTSRYKIYIIDEVHMLSNNAFNALLKTLEEPPPHVKFVFATTELRKIPVTILSRCQRFDLKRVDADVLAGHLKNIAAKEQVSIDAPALKLIASAAEGSVRDALSLLDQAIAQDAQKEGGITGHAIHEMLGLSDKSQCFDLIEAVFSGDIEKALLQYQQLYRAGADPVLLLQDVLELVHFITRLKLAPALEGDLAYSETERLRSGELAAKLSLVQLSNVWQMLLKGINETRFAPQPASAAEMVLVRIAHAADLPSPGDLIRSLQKDSQKTPAPSLVISHPVTPARETSAAPMQVMGNLALAVPASEQQQPNIVLRNFEEAVALFETHREPILLSHLQHEARLVSFAPGLIELSLSAQVPNDFTRRVAKALSDWTGQHWRVVASEAQGGATLNEMEVAAQQQLKSEAAAHPAIASVLDHFPGAEIAEVTPYKTVGE